MTGDRGKVVAGISLNDKVDHGAVILQTSKDGKKWLNDVTLSNEFERNSVQTESFYQANDVQLTNGCYFRVIIAYAVEKKVGEKEILFLKTDQDEVKKYVEVYEFYLQNEDGANSTNDGPSKTLGSVVRTKTKGYTGVSTIGIDDVHYGWELGQFFVSGYTRGTVDNQNKPVFLKNVGDQITLWFNLKQDITRLNKDASLTISDDDNGYDQYFQMKRTDMGHGTLIIRYTDEKGVKHEPEIYTNYLEANASTRADTIVKLFEEGDYEVALDYEIKYTPRKVAGVEIVPKYSRYRISFEFSVRNGNCMVYPFDTVTGVELRDGALTENGFRLDMAKSRYLTIDVQRSVAVEGVDGYTEDIRFNRPAKDGEEYLSEGIYTFRVKNLYTNESTEKKIYVGTADYLKQLSENKISVSQLYNVTKGGARTVSDESDTAISTISESEVQENGIATEQIQAREEGMTASTDETIDSAENQDTDSSNAGIVVFCICIIIVIIAIIIIKKKKSL